MFTVEYADNGSIRRSSEEQAYIFFEMNVKVKHNLDISNLNPIIEASGSVCNLEDVFFFLWSNPLLVGPKNQLCSFPIKANFPLLPRVP